MTLGDKLRQARLEHDLTLRDAADKAGISYGYLAKIERSEVAPGFAVIQALAKLYGLSLDKLAE